MIEITGNIWELDTDVICVTTNGIINLNGELIMGAGIAKQAMLRYPELPTIFGKHVKKYGNTPCEYKTVFGTSIVSLPTKHHWRGVSDLCLIRKSLQLIKKMFPDNLRIALPRPGCGNGGLIWDDIKIYIEYMLPEDRFIVVERY